MTPDTTKLEMVLRECKELYAGYCFGVPPDIDFPQYCALIAAHLTRAGFVSREAVMESLISLVHPNHASSIAVLFHDALDAVLEDVRALIEVSP